MTNKNDLWTTDFPNFECSEKGLLDYLHSSGPEVIQMAFGKMIHDSADREHWPTPWRLVAKNDKGELLMDWKYTPGAPHAFIDLPAEKLAGQSWTLNLSSSDGREITRTLTLRREGGELVWALDGYELERFGFARAITVPWNPTRKN